VTSRTLRRLALCALVAVGCGAPAPADVDPDVGRLEGGLLRTSWGHEVAPPPPEPPPATGFARYEGFFPNTELVTHEGKRVRFYDDLVEGRTVVINFMYTQCNGI